MSFPIVLVLCLTVVSLAMLVAATMVAVRKPVTPPLNDCRCDGCGECKNVGGHGPNQGFGGCV